MVCRGAVELAVAAAAEPVADRLAAGGRDRGDAGEAGEGRLRADASAMRPGDDQLRRHDRADARLVKQLRCERTDVSEDLTLELGGLGGHVLDSAGEAA